MLFLTTASPRLRKQSQDKFLLFWCEGIMNNFVLIKFINNVFSFGCKDMVSYQQ